MLTADQIASELTPHVTANNASIGETNRRLAKIGDGQGNARPATLLSPRDVLYRSDLDGNDRGVAILHPKCPIPLQGINGFYDTEVYIANVPGSSQVYIVDLADSGGFTTGGPTPTEALTSAAAFPSQDRFILFRLRPSLDGGLSIYVDVGAYAVAYEVGDGTLGYISSGSFSLPDPTDGTVYYPTAATLTSGQHRLIGVALSPTAGQFIAIPGAAATASGTLPERSDFVVADYEAIDFRGYYPCGYLYSYYGQTDFIEDDCLRLYDPRLIANKMLTGTGAGNVSGPGSSTDYALADWNGAAGTMLRSSGLLTDATNKLTVPGRLITQSGRNVAMRVVTAAGAVTLTTADDVVVVNKTSGAATVVNLPSSPTKGDSYCIKDGKGDAATNNITLTPAAGNIDGASTYVIATNYGGVFVVYNGTQWNVTVFFSGGSTSPLTTKGDVYTHSTVDARLPAGLDNSTLTPDSTQTLGLKWVPPLIVGAYNYNTNGTNYRVGVGFADDDIRQFSRYLEPAVDIVAATWESVAVHWPYIVVDPTGVLWMYYDGYNGSHYQIGLSRSYDGGRTWTKYASNPVLSYGATWEAGDVYGPVVLYDDAETDATKRWKMWYTGNINGFSGPYKIGYAYSADGLSWTKYASSPVLVSGSGWESSGVVSATIARLNSTYYLFYGGFNVSGVSAQGVVTFTDPTGTYTRSANNPLLSGDGITTTLTGAVSINDTTINVTSSATFPIGAAIWVGDGTNRYLSYVTGKGTGTLTLSDPAPVAVGTSGSFVRSVLYSSLQLSQAWWDDAWRFAIVGYNPLSPTGLREVDVAGYASAALDKITVDYQQGLMVKPTLAETQGGNMSWENLRFADLRQWAKRFLAPVSSNLTVAPIYAPMATGDTPGPVLIDNGDGECVMVQIA